MKKKASILFNLLLVLSMLLTAFAFQPAFSATEAAVQQDTPEPRPNRSPQDVLGLNSVEEGISKDVALLKIDPLLRDQAQAGGKDLVDLYVSVQGFADLEQYLTNAIYRPAVFAGIRNVYGKAYAGDLISIAQQEGVLAIVAVKQELQLPFDPQPEGAPDLAAQQARMQELLANELTFEEAQAQSVEAGVQGWFDVEDGHKSSTAWEKGFTGEGVIVGVLDDGIDFGHPDLQGTYAWVTDEDSPYYGWPMAFSQVSMQYFVEEVYFQNLGANGITQGWNGSRWSDTTHTVEASSPFGGGAVTGMYKPIDSGVAYEYTMPATSTSGFYKFGSLHEKNLLGIYGHRVAILVVDENIPGVYDTVYVDLDNDKDFSDEKPVTQDSPEVYRDMDGDGYADISGGLLVWISDGDNPPPMADWLWGVECGDEVGTVKACPDSGELLLFAGPFDAGYTHGTQCASNIAGQGVVNSGLTAQPFRTGGMVQGAAPNVGLMDFGNHYYSGTDEDEFLVVALGYDGIPDSGDEIQIATNSYGNFRQMWGSWGYFGRLITALNMTIAPTSVWVFSAGNEGPGYGPQEGDGGPTTIQAGSSTQYGSTNWDSIFSADQIMYGDPNSFFSKGPNRDGSSGLDVLANGGRGAGDEGINYYGYNGAESWATWGGTSRSAPVAGGNLALVYQAYHDRYGEWPTWDVAKALFKSGATNSLSSPFFQGGGVVNADRATDLAAGIYGVYAMPDEWQVGDWQGTEYLNFAKTAWAGNVYTKTYTVANPSGYDIQVDLTDGVMTKMSSTELTFTTSSESEESAFNFHSPDYLMQMDASLIPADAELMVVRYVHPYDTFDPVYDFTASPNSSWRFMLYNWTDQNGDGMLWEDTDGNGVVNHVDDLALGPDNDGFYRPDFSDPGTEIQEGEYVRVDYEFGGLAVPIAVHDPLERMADGYYFGIQHRSNDHSVDQTTFKIGVEFYKRADWAWLSLSDSSLTISAESEETFVATLDLPTGTEPGAYEGVIYMHTADDYYHPEHETALPVVVNVISDLPDDGSFTLGGGAMADTLYQNSWTNGYFNWYGGGWTGAGDWRHYFFNVDEADVENSNLLIHTSWNDGYPTDINTWVLGPTYDCASNAVGPCAWYQPGTGQPDPSVFGPYTLQPIASSGPFLAGAAYPFDTSTGGPDDWILAPLDMAGLHEIALHNVLYSGEELTAQFQVDVGTINLGAAIDPSVGMAEVGSVLAEVYTDTGSLDLEFTPTLEIPDLYATLFGGLATDHQNYTTPIVDSNQCGNGPACADTVWETVDVVTPGTTKLFVNIPMPSGEDVDLFVYYDVNDNGFWDQGTDSLVGASTNSAGNDDFVTVNNPALGTYLIGILGWDLSVANMNLDWYAEITAPGPLPTETVDVFSNTITVTQDAPFDPTTASFTMTATTDERAAALNLMLSNIPSGNDVDVYVSDETGIIAQSQTNSNGDEQIMIAPPTDEYRFPEGKEFTVWVHGFDVPSAPITPTLHVWWDSLNLWLSATHPDVHVNAIAPGETVSVTLNFEKAGWSPGDPDLSARVVVGPSVLPGAFDELVVIERVDPPGPPVFDPGNLELNYTVESARGPSPFIRWSLGGAPVSTALGGPSEQATWTIEVTNHDAFTATLDFQAEVDNYTQYFLIGDTSNGYYVQSFDGIVVTPTIGTCAFDPFWIWVQWTLDLGPGETATCAFQTTTDSAMTLDHFSALWESNYLGLASAADVYNRSFRTTGSEKIGPAVAAPSETFSYYIDLWNPSSTDRDVYVSDMLPPEVAFVSASAGASYDPGTHMVTWSGTMAGSSLTPTTITIEVMLAGDTPEGLTVENTAYVSYKYMGAPILSLSADTYVDDGMDPDLVVEKTVDTLLGPVGTGLVYTIVLENEGTEGAVNAMLHDEIPSMVDIDETSITGGAMYADGVLHWTGDLAAGASKTFTFDATINDTATDNYAIINAAQAWADNQWWTAYNSALTEVQGIVDVFMPIVLK